MMNAIATLWSQGWTLVLGSAWPLLLLATGLWLVMMLSALRRIARRQTGGLTLALLAGAWAVAAALAVSPVLSEVATKQPAAGLSLALLAAMVGYGLLRSRSALR